jgi:hypothetical protein
MEFWRYRRQAAPDQAAAREAVLRDDVGPPDRREAFAAGLMQGRREERARHRGHPMIAMLVAVVALAGAAVLVLAAREGSFSRGGEVVDHHLAVAADKAQAAGRDAAVQTGQAIQDAGATLQQKASGANGQTP